MNYDTWIANDILNELNARLDPLYPEQFDCAQDWPRSEFSATLDEMIKRGELQYYDGRYGLPEQSA